MIIEGSGAGSGSVPLTNGSGPGGLKTYGTDPDPPTLLFIIAYQDYVLYKYGIVKYQDMIAVTYSYFYSRL